MTYQRNGVAGSGFHALAFDWKDEHGKLRRMVGFVMSEENKPLAPWHGSYGVIDPAEPHLGWRGDYFIEAMREAIAQYDEGLDLYVEYQAPRVAP